MKTSIKTLVAGGMMALVLSTSTVYAAVVANETSISASAVSVSSIKRLIVSGNVEVTVTQNPKSKLLYANESNASVSVKKVGNALYVDSKSTTGAKITVYVDDIYRIDATDDAVILTDDALTLKYLQVFLTGRAKAELNAKTENLYTSIKNTSKLNLKGSTDFYSIDMDKSSRIALESFKSKKTDSVSDVFVASRS